MKNIKEDEKRNRRPIIIDRPDLLGSSRRWTEWGITTIGWVMWVFICRPILIALLWALGLRVFYHQMVKLGGLGGIVELFWIYFWVVVAIWIIIRSWNLYNYLKFRNKNARKHSRPVGAREIEKFFKLPSECLGGVHSSSVVEVDFIERNDIRVKDISKDRGAVYSGHFDPGSLDRRLMRLRRLKDS